KYFAVVTERGRLDLNAPEDTIWAFSTEEVQRFAEHPHEGTPAPLTMAQVSNDKDGPLIENARWLADSSGIAFTLLEKRACCKFHQLALADIKTHKAKTLTPEDQDVGEFDIRSDHSYVYEVKAPVLLNPPKEDPQPTVVLTGKSLSDILFPHFEQRMSPF